MKTLLVLVVVIIGCILFRPSEAKVTEVSETTAFPLATSTPPTVPIFDDEEVYVFDDVLDEKGLINVYTRPIANPTILRSKPWESSVPNLDVALQPGIIIQVYPNPFGESEWVEVWVPQYRVTGYIKIDDIGEVK